MPERKRIAAGNWKMHTSVADAVSLASALRNSWRGDDVRQMIIAPPFTHLMSVSDAIKGSDISLAAQNCHWESQGAFTGEVSLAMLADTGVSHVIIGHSERRELFHETNEIVSKKVNAALKAGMHVILCCGEPLSVREAGGAKDFVGQQLRDNLLHLDRNLLGHVIIAYEPIWAIGTGVTATADQAQEMHAYIRSLVSDAYDQDAADEMTILYGGSVKAANAEELFGRPDVDGGLVGGASLKAEEFLQIAGAL